MSHCPSIKKFNSLHLKNNDPELLLLKSDEYIQCTHFLKYWLYKAL